MTVKNDSLVKGLSLRYFEKVSSSNDIALAILKKLKKKSEGMGFITNCQTNGRGRRGNVWISKKNYGIYMSMILCPNRKQLEWPTISFLVSNAVYETLIFYFPVLKGKLKLKWPNDLILNNYKLGGILIESTSYGLAIGIGINYNNSPEFIENNWIPGNLKMFCNFNNISKNIIVKGIMNNIYLKYLKWEKKGGTKEINLWKKNCGIIGKKIKVRNEQTFFSGILKNVKENGNLILEDNSGKIIVITSGDVELIKDYNVINY